MSKGWKPRSYEEAIRRAGGRRRYNSMRRLQAFERREKIAYLLGRYGMGYGSQARIARDLNVSEATISRDIASIKKDAAPCPTCGKYRRVTAEYDRIMTEMLDLPKSWSQKRSDDLDEE